MANLGKLKRLDPRSLWPHEGRDFTPWLADHIDHLGETLGLDLECVDVEADAGDFAADIVAKDVGSDRLVVIENQLEATDHLHLGQLLTYAARLEAGVVIWISRQFREEHRQALDWLNRAHGAATDFFGVILELLQIDESKPAVAFRPVAFPNDWFRSSVRGKRGQELTPRQLRYLDFFQGLIDELRETHRFTNARAAQPQNWYSFSTGFRGFSYAVSFSIGSRLRAELYIDRGSADENEAAFRQLCEQREAIEREFGERLEWQPLEGRRACRIACYREGTIDDSAEDLERYREWAVDRLLRFRRVFGTRLAKV